MQINHYILNTPKSKDVVGQLSLLIIDGALPNTLKCNTVATLCCYVPNLVISLVNSHNAAMNAIREAHNRTAPGGSLNIFFLGHGTTTDREYRGQFFEDIADGGDWCYGEDIKKTNYQDICDTLNAASRNRKNSKRNVTIYSFSCFAYYWIEEQKSQAHVNHMMPSLYVPPVKSISMKDNFNDPKSPHNRTTNLRNNQIIDFELILKDDWCFVELREAEKQNNFRSCFKSLKQKQPTQHRHKHQTQPTWDCIIL